MSRIYHATKLLSNKQYVLIGVFSNRKHLLEAVETTGLSDDNYIKGGRKDKAVTVSSVSTGFVNKCLNIYRIINEKEEVEFRVLEIVPNNINPQLIGGDDEL